MTHELELGINTQPKAGVEPRPAVSLVRGAEKFIDGDGGGPDPVISPISLYMKYGQANNHDGKGGE